MQRSDTGDVADDGGEGLYIHPMFKVYCEKKAAEGPRRMNIIGRVFQKIRAVIVAVMGGGKIRKPVFPAA